MMREFKSRTRHAAPRNEGICGARRSAFRVRAAPRRAAPRRAARFARWDRVPFGSFCGEQLRGGSPCLLRFLRTRGAAGGAAFFELHVAVRLDDGELVPEGVVGGNQLFELVGLLFREVFFFAGVFG